MPLAEGAASVEGRAQGRRAAAGDTGHAMRRANTPPAACRPAPHTTACLRELPLALALSFFFDTAVKSHFDQC